MEKKYDEFKKVTLISIILNIILSVIKVLAGLLGNSTAIIADGLHSASDIITSIGILIGNKISKKPSDDKHPYGHEKAESIIAFILAVILLIVALKIGYNGIILVSSLNKIEKPTILPLIVALISIAIKEYQYQITIKVAKRIGSTVLKADAWHHRSDALSSIGAFIGIIGGRMGVKILDPIACIIVALIVVKVAISILREAIDDLMDKSIGVEDLDIILGIINKEEDIYGVEDIKSRKYGTVAYVELSILLNKYQTLEEAHNIAEKLEKKITTKLEYIKEVRIHMEPYGR